MATKKCPYCAEEIQAEAKKCKHCVEWLEDKDGKKAASTEAEQWREWVERYAALPEAQQLGQWRQLGLDKRAALERVWKGLGYEGRAEPIAWSRATFNEKQAVGSVLAQYCDQAGSTSWVDTKDNNSGKKLAKYSMSRGFKVYEETDRIWSRLPVPRAAVVPAALLFSEAGHVEDLACGLIGRV